MQKPQITITNTSCRSRTKQNLSMKIWKLILLLQGVLLVSIFTSCTTFDLDRYKSAILDSSGQKIQSLLTAKTINDFKCSNPDHYFLYAKLYIENIGFDRYSIILLDKALSEKNIFYTESYDLYFRELSKAASNFNDINKFISKYPCPPNLPYSDFIEYLKTGNNPQSISSISGQPDLSGVLLLSSVKNRSSWNLIKEYVFTYIASIYSNRTSTLPLDLKKLDLLSKSVNSHFIQLITDNLEGISVNRDTAVKALMESSTIEHGTFIRNLMINSNNKSSFEYASDVLKDTDSVYMYNWVIHNRPIKGHNGVKKEVEKLLSHYSENGTENYTLRGFELYNMRINSNESMKMIVDYNNDYPGLYHSYTILSGTLRDVLRNRTGRRFYNELSGIELTEFNIVRNTVIYNLLTLIYPNEEKWFEKLSSKYPLSYGSLRNGLSEIEKNISRDNSKIPKLSGTAKISSDKLNYYIAWDMKSDVFNFKPETESNEETAYLYSIIRDLLYKNEDYYRAVAMSKKIAEVLYGNVFSKMDIETFYHLYPLHYKDIVMKYSEEYKVDPALIFAVMREESHYHKSITSSAAAVGLMQIMPSTAQWLAPMVGINRNEIDLTNPDQNIKFGAYYLRFIMDRVNDINLVMAGYNAGHGRAIRWESSFRNLNKYEGYEHIPFEETRHYIRKVYQSYEAYSFLLNNKSSLAFAE